MIDYLLDLEHVPLKDGYFSFAVSLPAELIILILSIVSVISWYSYRNSRESLPKAGWITLIVLRACLLSVVFFCLLGPRWNSPVTLHDKSSVAILIDDSKSMSRKDSNYTTRQLSDIAYATGITDSFKEQLSPEEEAKVLEMTRADIVQKAISKPSLDFKARLNEKYLPKYFKFARNLVEENEEFDETQRDSTGAGNAIRETISKLTGKNLSAIVLFSDGGNNYGQNPVYTAKFASAQGIPIFTVGVGGALPAKDISVEPVEYKETLLKGDELSISTKIATSGYEQKAITVLLTRNDVEVARKIVNVSEEEPRTDVEFQVKLDKAGDYSFEVLVPVEPEEAIAENNSRKFVVKVVEDKIKVLFVSGSASWEYRYLKHALMRDPTMESCVLLQRVDGWFHEGNHPLSSFPESFTEMSQFDVVILNDIAVEGYLTGTQLDLLEKFIGTAGGGLIYIAGETNGLSILNATSLSKLLPVGISSVPLKSNYSISFRPRKTPEGIKHPAYRFAGGEEVNDNLWRKLAAFYWYYPISEVKPGAEILLEHPSRKANGKPAPLAVQAYYGSGRVFFSALDSTWRWRKETGDKYFYKYWGQLIRFFAQERLLGGKRVWVSTDLPEYRRGATVSIIGRALDKDLNVASITELPCQLLLPDGSLKEIILRKNDDRARAYNSEYNPVIPGIYRAKVTWDGLTAERSFEVRYISPEQATLVQDQELLTRISAESGGQYGGQYIRISELASIFEYLKERQTETVEDIHESLLDTPLVLFLFVFFLAFEWIFRRIFRLM